MTRFDAIIFDMDGLLLDTETLALSAFLDTCADLGLEPRTDVFLRCLGTNHASGQQVLNDGLAGHTDPVRFRHLWDDKYRHLTTTGPIALKDGVISLLDHIATLHMPAAVATSTHTTRAQEKLARAGILERFTEVVGGEQVQHSKPSPDIYLRVASLVGARPHACLALEDSENGVRAALSAGMTVVQIPDLVHPSDQFRQLGHIVLASLADVTTYPFPERLG